MNKLTDAQKAARTAREIETQAYREEGRAAWNGGKGSYNGGRLVNKHPEGSLAYYAWHAGFNQDVRSAAELIRDWEALQK